MVNTNFKIRLLLCFSLPFIAKFLIYSSTKHSYPFQFEIRKQMPFEVSKKADLNIRKTQKFEKKLATKYHKTSSLTPTSSKPFDKTNTCDTILEKGEWTNFKKIGSWERYNIDSNNQLSIDEQQPRNFRLDAVFYNGKIDRNKNSKILSDPKCKKPYHVYLCSYISINLIKLYN